MKNIIPVVFASDDGYAPFLGVAISSLIEKSSPEYEYHLYVLQTGISVEHQQKILEMSCAHIHITVIDLKEKSKEIAVCQSNNHLTMAALYRLYIPELLPQYEKILYLDSDLVVVSDVAELFFSCDVTGCCLGVARFVMVESWKKRCHDVLGTAYGFGFNSGVLLMNVAEMNKHKVRERCVALLQEDWKQETPQYIYQDQDVLHIVCEGKTAFFPMGWNAEWLHLVYTLKNVSDAPLTGAIGEEYEEAMKNPKILHYDSEWKPWSFPELPLARIFWDFARRTDFYEEILLRETRERRTNLDRPFPWHLIDCGSKIVIYGAGLVGRSFLKQISASSYCFVRAVCDQNAKNLKRELFPVVTKEALSSLDFDMVLISVEWEPVAEAIKKDLLALGIPESKIKWFLEES